MSMFDYPEETYLFLSTTTPPPPNNNKKNCSFCCLSLKQLCLTAFLNTVFLNNFTSLFSSCYFIERNDIYHLLCCHQRLALKRLVDISMGVITPLSEQLTKPLPHAMVLVNLQELSTGAYKLLPEGGFCNSF